MLKFQEQIEISASPETVFGVITDLGAYKEWNPWIVSAEGFLAEGKLIDVKAKMGDKDIQVQHRILTIKPFTEFCWCDVGWFTKFAYGQRVRFIEPLKDGSVKYRVELTVTGPAQWIVKLFYGRYMEKGLKLETRALKKQAETINKATIE
jgi:hypothetical protein